MASVDPLLAPGSVEVGQHVDGPLLQGAAKGDELVNRFGSPWLSAPIWVSIISRPRAFSTSPDGRLSTTPML